jgi:hypothetical protein
MGDDSITTPAPVPSPDNSTQQILQCRFNRDVVVPKNGGGKEEARTEGFNKYTDLVNKHRDTYESLHKSLKCQYVVDEIISPLLNENRNFYRYFSKRKEYGMVDLSNEDAKKAFARDVVMQKIRDASKSTNSNGGNTLKRSVPVLPTTKVEPKKKVRTLASTSTLSPPRLLRTPLRTYVHEYTHSQERPEDDSTRYICSSSQSTRDSPRDLGLSFTPLNYASARSNFSPSYLSELNFTPLKKNEKEKSDEPLFPTSPSKNQDISSKLRPLINILSYYPNVNKYIYLDDISKKVDNYYYNCVSVVENDLKSKMTSLHQYQHQQQQYCGKGNTEESRMVNDLLSLISTFCKGLK